jgi:hypothetical protein
MHLRAIDSRRLAYAAVGLPLLLVAPLAQADWEFGPSIGVGAIYSDNVFLAPDALAQEDTVAEIVPGLIARYEGPRSDLNLDYQMLNYFYEENSDLDNTYHRLNADLTAEWVREALFLDAGAQVRQQIIDPAGPIGSSPAIGGGNVTDQATYFLSPYWRTVIGGNTEWQLRYTAAQIDYDDDTLEDSDQQTAAASLVSQDPGQLLSWGLSYRGTRTDYDSGERIELQRAFADLGIRVATFTRLIILAGYEENDFQTSSVDPPEGSFWAAGVRSSRAGRFEFEALAGERFFGETYRFLWRQEARRWDLELTYVEDFTTSAGSSLELDPADLPSLPGETVGTLSSEVYLSRAGRGVFSFNTPRTRIGVSYFDERREFQVSNNEEEVRGGDIGISWRARSRLTFSAGIARRDNTLIGETAPDRIRSANLGASYQLSPRMVASLDGGYTDRRSEVSTRDYTERSVGVRLNAQF